MTREQKLNLLNIDSPDYDPVKFHKALEEWCAGDFFLTKDNFDDLAELFIESSTIHFEDGQHLPMMGGVIPSGIPVGGPYAKRGLRPSVGEIVTVVGVVLAMLVFGIGLTIFEAAAREVK